MSYLGSKSVASPVWLFPPIIDWYDPVAEGGLPTDPTVGDRYGADNTGYGWTIDYIYEWDGLEWVESAPEEGWMLWDLLGLIFWTFFSGGWMEVGAGTFIPYTGATDNIDIGTNSLSTSGNLGFYGVTPVNQPDTVVDADGSLEDATTKINQIIDRLQELGLLA